VNGQRCAPRGSPAVALIARPSVSQPPGIGFVCREKSQAWQIARLKNRSFGVCHFRDNKDNKSVHPDAIFFHALCPFPLLVATAVVTSAAV